MSEVRDDKACPRVWALLTHRRGDNNQVLALAQALGWPFETRSIQANWLRKLPKRLLADRLLSLTPRDRHWLQPPWPDLVIAMGHRTVPAARAIRRLSGGHSKLVHLGNPRLDSDPFDLVVTMPQYGRQTGKNVIRLPIAMGEAQASDAPTADEQAFLKAFPRPHRLMILGGRTRLWRLDRDSMIAVARKLIARSAEDGGSLLVVGSPRTDPKLLQQLEDDLGGTRHRLIRGGMPRYSALRADADELYITGDSVSMLSDAILTGKPVGMIDIAPKVEGRLRYALADSGLTRPPTHDLRNFWAIVRENLLAGTVDEPRAAKIRDPGQTAAAAVRALMHPPGPRGGIGR